MGPQERYATAKQAKPLGLGPRGRGPARWPLLLLVIGLVWGGIGALANSGRVALILDIKGPIGPASSDYIHRGLERAKQRGADLVVIRIDTPGGLDTSMREIIRDIIDSPIPVASYVPSGGRAASAGTYILYASHVSAMAPGANLGAATPVQIGGGKPRFPFPTGGEPEKDADEDEKPAPKKGTSESEKDKPATKTPESKTDKSKPAKPHPEMKDKMINDAVAYIRSLAQMRGRNAEWAEKAVSEAASLPAEEARDKGVIDLVAGSVETLITAIDGRRVEVRGRKQVLDTKALLLETYEPDWRTQLLAILTNPNVAYILMLIGIYGLIFEIYSPGMIFPGVLGAISILLALYAFHVLPINFAGLALTLLGIGLMVAELFVPSIGVLGFGGAAAFVIGSIMLLDTDVPGFGVSWPLIAAIAVVSSASFMLVLMLLAKSRRRAVVSGPEEMLGSIGQVLDWEGHEGRIRVHGEIWKARAPRALQPGRAVRIAEIDGLTLVVEPDTKGR